MRKVVGALFLLLLTSGYCEASGKNGVYTVLGVGTHSCGKWAEDRRVGDGQYIDVAWIEGFVTAYNLYIWPEKDVAEGIDVDGLIGWVDNYCEAHPLNDLASAANALVIELRTRHHS